MGISEGSVLKRGTLYAAVLAAAVLLLSSLGLETRQVIASAMVLAVVLGTVLFWEMRLSFALMGTAILIASGLLGVHKFVEFSSLNIIVFLAGMMIFVGYLEKNAFFEFLISRLLRVIGGGRRVFVLLMLLAAFFAALVDEVTSILFMLSIVLYLTAKLRVNPVPFIIMTVFATNIGSSATAVGNPVGVIIALNAKLSFSDFLAVATPISAVALLVGMGVMYLTFRREIEEFGKHAKGMPIHELVESHSGSRGMLASAAFFVVVFALLVAHQQIEEALGIEKNSMLLGTALAAAGVVLLIEGQNARHFVETKVDWWTLFFFMLLFASVGALQESGVMGIASQAFASAVGENRLVAMASIMGASGILSASLDNVLAVAVFTPMVHDLQSTPIGGEYLWWALLFGATLFGNLTIIGSTANIVALGMVEKRGLPKISFMQWLKVGAPLVLATAATAFLMLYLGMQGG